MQGRPDQRSDGAVADALDDLDAAQRAAVTTPSTLVAVIAAAGSGKTRVLTRRITHRVAVGTAEARSTLALTFTREAAGELRRRLRRAGLRESVETGTFHSIALALLRQRWRDLDQPVPTIVDDRNRLLRDAGGGVPLTVLRTEADWAAALGLRAAGYVDAARSAGRRTASSPADVAAALAGYEALKRRRGVVDLDDLLTMTAAAMTEDPLWADVVRHRFQHVLVDEAQDLNPVQFRLLRLLVGDRRDLFLVGDPAQAIYGFNGSDPSLLADVGRHLDGVEIVHLPVNHRSTPAIVGAGMHVLRTAGQPADAVAARDDGPPVELHGFADADDEAVAVARLVRGLDPAILRTGQAAVLARTNAQLPALAGALDAAGVTVRRAAVTPGSPLAAAVRAATALPSASRLRAWAHDATERPPDGDAGTADDDVVAAQRRVAGAVLEYLHDHPFGDGAGLRSWIATANPFATGPDLTGVDVLTFHGAKGREWDTVVVTGAETGLVPHRSATSVAAKAEEARLLHVALTRARERLVVTWSRRRGGYGRRVSPLLVDLDLSVPAPAPIPDELRPPPPSPAVSRRRRLEAWRATAARAADVLPEAVCSDGDLEAIVVADPASPVALAEATGLGRLTATRLFAGVRAALDDPAVDAADR